VIRPSRPIEDGIAKSPAKASLLHKLRDHQTVVFAPHIKAAEDFAAEYKACGMRVALITGAMASEDRDKALAAFRRRDIRVLVNVHVLTEGWDSPEVEVVILARRFRSVGAMIQATGRGARPCPGKERFLVLDLCGVTHILGHPFADREYSLEGQGIRGASDVIRLRLCGRCKAEMPVEGPCVRCGWTRPPPETP
jgi:superfamily II DNA or RNA helicase